MKINKTVLFLIVIIIIVFTFLLLGQNSFAKYKTIINGEGKAEIAEPIILLEGLDSIAIDGVNTTGVYHFTVKNYNQDNINEVELKYKLKVISDTDESIVYTLYKDNKQINLNNNITEEITMPHSNQIVHDYKLEIKYDKKQATQNTDIVKDVRLELDAVQVD